MKTDGIRPRDIATAGSLASVIDHLQLIMTVICGSDLYLTIIMISAIYNIRLHVSMSMRRKESMCCKQRRRIFDMTDVSTALACTFCFVFAQK